MPVVLSFLKYYSVSVRLKVVGVHAMTGTWRSGVLHPLVALYQEKQLSIHTEQGVAGPRTGLDISEGGGPFLRGEKLSPAGNRILILGPSSPVTIPPELFWLSHTHTHTIVCIPF
jgi:hypothetical protein